MEILKGSGLILLSFLPGFIYLILMFLTTPYKSWKFSRAMVYFLAGCISTPFLLLIHQAFPFLKLIYLIPETALTQVLIMAFIQVALIEELSKYVLYLFFRSNILKANVNQHPLATMIYAGSVSLGFAFIENIMYGFNSGIDVLPWRAFTSVIIHMTCGMMMGYFISLSYHKFKLKTNPTNDILGVSIFDVILKKKPTFRKVFYAVVGISMAVFFHGLYDFNLFGVYEFQHTYVDENISWSIQLIILFISLHIVKEMSNHLVKLNINNN
jgi:RsiW-degrading membrane proteinase PrsW (M82 family)